MQCFMTEAGIIHTIESKTSPSSYRGAFTSKGETVLLLEPNVSGYANQRVIQESRRWSSLAHLAVALESKNESLGELVEALDEH